MSQTEIKKKQKQFISSPKKKNKKANSKYQKPDINYDYDDEADVLYAHVGDHPVPAQSVEYENGIVLRIDPQSKKYVGFTIINYMNRRKQGKLKNIPHFKQVDLPAY